MMGLGPNVARKESSPFEGYRAQKEFIKIQSQFQDFIQTQDTLRMLKSTLLNLYLVTSYSWIGYWNTKVFPACSGAFSTR